MTLMIVHRYIEALRDLVGGEARIEYEWFDANNQYGIITTTIDEHLAEIREDIDDEFIDPDDVEVSQAGVYEVAHRVWLYKVVSGQIPSSIDANDALGQMVANANGRIPALVRALEQRGHTVTATEEGDLMSDPDVEVGGYTIQISEGYSLKRLCDDGKIQYWPERRSIAEVIRDLEEAN